MTYTPSMNTNRAASIGNTVKPWNITNNPGRQPTSMENVNSLFAKAQKASPTDNTTKAEKNADKMASIAQAVSIFTAVGGLAVAGFSCYKTYKESKAIGSGGQNGGGQPGGAPQAPAAGNPFGGVPQMSGAYSSGDNLNGAIQQAQSTGDTEPLKKEITTSEQQYKNQEAAIPAMTTVAQGKVDSTQTELNTATKDLEPANKQLTEATTAVDKAEKDAGIADKAIGEAQGSFDKAEADEGAAKDNLNAADTSINLAQGELSKLQAESAKSLSPAERIAVNKQLAEARGRLTAAETKKTEAERAMNTAKTAKTAANDKLKAAKAAKETKTKAIEAAKKTKTDLETKIKGLKETVTAKTSELEKAKQELGAATAKQNEAKAAQQQLKTTIDKAITVAAAEPSIWQKTKNVAAGAWNGITGFFTGK